MTTRCDVLGRLPGAHLLRRSGAGTIVASLSGELTVLTSGGGAQSLPVRAAVLDAVMLDAVTEEQLICVATPSAVEVFNLESKARVVSFQPGAGQPTRLVALHQPAGLAWGDESGGLHVWRRGLPDVHRWQRHRKSIHQLEILRLGGGERVATGADDRFVHLTDPSTGLVTATCHPHIDWLEGMVAAAGPDGRGYALTIDRRRMVTWIFDGAGAVVDTSSADLEKASVWTAWWSADHAAPIFAVATEDRRLRLSVGSGQPRFLDLPATAVAIAAAGGGQSLAIAGDDGSLVEICLRPRRTGPLMLMSPTSAPLLSLQPSPVHDGYLGLDTSGAVLSIRPERMND